MDRLLDIAQEVGIYVIARPGPYINAETDARRVPRLADHAGRAGRAPTHADYLAATDEWSARIDPIIARHQLTNGTGTVILYQIENELASTGTSQQNYMQHLYDKVRADGITVPIFHNDKGRNGIWVPASCERAGHRRRAGRPVRLRRLPGRHLPHRRDAAAPRPRPPTGASRGRAAPPAASTASPEHTRLRGRVRRRLVRLLGQQRAPTTAPPCARAPATSGSSTRPTSPTG